MTFNTKWQVYYCIDSNYLNNYYLLLYYINDIIAWIKVTVECRYTWINYSSLLL